MAKDLRILARGLAEPKHLELVVCDVNGPALIPAETIADVRACDPRAGELLHAIHRAQAELSAYFRTKLEREVIP